MIPATRLLTGFRSLVLAGHQEQFFQEITKNMRYITILALLLTVVGCNSGCNGIQAKQMTVEFTLENVSTNNLNGVQLECLGRTLSVGILIPGSNANLFDVPWPDAQSGKVSFFDRQTLKPYEIDVLLISINEKIQSGKCHHITIRILSHEKAEVICE